MIDGTTMVNRNKYFPMRMKIAHTWVYLVHCLEAIRTSLTCYPDLNLHSYYWSGRKTHDLTVDARVTRQCIDWDRLQESLSSRDFSNEDIIRDDGQTQD